VQALTANGVIPNQRQLADASHMQPMHVSKLVRILEQAGLLKRRQDPTDPRALRLTMTARAHRTVNSARRIASTLEHQRLAVIGGPSSDRATQLKAALQVLLREAERTP
jgi:MarR family transcriptional regulator, organic hydroperoxide resistance regulator